MLQNYQENAPLNFLKLLAIGLVQQDIAVQEGNDQPATLLNPQIRRGWEQLCYQCFSRGVLPPRTLPELVDWLHRPVDEWNGVGEHFRAAQFTEPLLEDGHPSELCRKLGSEYANIYNPRLELQDDNFRQLLEACRKLQDAEQYTQDRPVEWAAIIHRLRRASSHTDNPTLLPQPLHDIQIIPAYLSRLADKLEDDDLNALDGRAE